MIWWILRVSWSPILSRIQTNQWNTDGNQLFPGARESVLSLLEFPKLNTSEVRLLGGQHVHMTFRLNDDVLTFSSEPRENTPCCVHGPVACLSSWAQTQWSPLGPQNFFVWSALHSYVVFACRCSARGRMFLFMWENILMSSLILKTITFPVLDRQLNRGCRICSGSDLVVEIAPLWGRRMCFLQATTDLWGPLRLPTSSASTLAQATLSGRTLVLSQAEI